MSCRHGPYTAACLSLFSFAMTEMTRHDLYGWLWRECSYLGAFISPVHLKFNQASRVSLLKFLGISYRPLINQTKIHIPRSIRESERLSSSCYLPTRLALSKGTLKRYKEYVLHSIRNSSNSWPTYLPAGQ